MCRLMASKGAGFTEKELGIFFCNEGSLNPDASGILGIDDNEASWIKGAIPGPSFWHSNKKTIQDIASLDIVFCHVRKATHGSPEENCNNHPIVHTNEDGQVTGVVMHNGVVEPSEWLLADGETDTEQLLSWVEKDGFKSWGNFRGYGAVVLWIAGELFCWRQRAPLYISTTGKGLQLVQFRSNMQAELLPEGIVYRIDGNRLIEVMNVRMKSLWQFPYQFASGFNVEDDDSWKAWVSSLGLV